MRPKLNILVIFAVYINITNGLNLQIIRGVKEIDIINAVKKYMTGKKGLIYDLKTQNKIIDNLRRTVLDDKDVPNEKEIKNFNNKVLVKRIIPHGYAVSKYDYDSKFNTLYKPLVRVHKTRALKDDNSDFMNKEFIFERLNFEPNKDSKDKYTLLFMFKNSNDINPPEHDESNNVDIFSKSALIEPFKLKIPNSELITDDLNEGSLDIKKDKTSGVVKRDKLNKILKNGDIIRLNSIESTNIANKEIYNIILGMFGKKERDKLRASMLITKSAEEEDEYRPPKYLFHVSEEESNGKKPPMQHNPYWNYWTYDKGLYMDTCKGDQLEAIPRRTKKESRKSDHK